MLRTRKCLSHKLLVEKLHLSRVTRLVWWLVRKPFCNRPISMQNHQHKVWQWILLHYYILICYFIVLISFDKLILEAQLLPDNSFVCSLTKVNWGFMRRKLSNFSRGLRSGTPRYALRTQVAGGSRPQTPGSRQPESLRKEALGIFDFGQKHKSETYHFLLR